MESLKNKWCRAVVVCAAALTLCGGSRTVQRPPSDVWEELQPVAERTPRATELLAYPGEGLIIEVNPPRFCWTPNDGAASYLLQVRHARVKSPLVSVAESSTVHASAETFEPGIYEWQVVYRDASGAPIGRSKTRKFTVQRGVPELKMPDVNALESRLAGVRPRMFLAGERLGRIRKAVAEGRVPSWERLRKSADDALREPSYAEPEAYHADRPSDQEWNRVYTRAKIASAHLARTALMYRLTSNRTYLAGARRWMMTLAAWNPEGITSHRLKQTDGSDGNDEASMAMLERMSFAWDWVGNDLEPGERALVLASVKERGEQVLRKLKAEDFLSHPYQNHEGRALAFLGEAGLAFLGDIPEAKQWLDYVLRCYLTSYPGWGGDEGGWAQGINYWSIYMYWLTNFAEALREVDGTDILLQPFYRNTGYLGIYFHPPYAPRAAFGDGGYHRPSEVESLLVDYLAEVNRDPMLKWQAQGILKNAPPDTGRWHEWYMEDVVATWRAAAASDLAPQAPSQLEGSRHFSDIGWVAMHSTLGDAANDVWAMFKSSRFGSFSHSHADQNTFQLNAWGHALAIDSGYYPSYGTPHDNLWTRQTQAHNAILVNGRGQPPHTWEAAGRIETFERHGIVTVVRGQAADAYNLPQPPELARLWSKLLPQPPPPMAPKVKDFQRTAVFVASKTRPVLFIQDYVEADAPATYDWLLHALNRMSIDERSAAITIRDGDVRLAVRLIATQPLRFSQSNRFSVPPEAAANTAYVSADEQFPDQWHFKATTGASAGQVKFLAILVPYRDSEPEPEIARIGSGDSAGFRVGGAEVLAWWGSGRTGVIRTGRGKTAEARMIVRATPAGEDIRVQ